MTIPENVQVQAAIDGLSDDARALFEMLPDVWMASGLRRRHIEYRLGRSPSSFEAARDELLRARLAEHRGGGVYGRTLRAIRVTGRVS